MALLRKTSGALYIREKKERRLYTLFMNKYEEKILKSYPNDVEELPKKPQRHEFVEIVLLNGV